MALPKKNVAEETVEETETVETAVTETETVDVLEHDTPQPEATVSVPATATEYAPPAAVTNGGAVVDQLANSGFTGLKIDWTSFPTVVLDNGDFCTADGNTLDTPREIHVRLMQSRSRFVLRTNTDDDDDAELAYTYDMAELNNPVSELAVKVTKWKQEEGLDYSIKEYIEAVGVVEDDDSQLNGEMVLLQIPPTARGRFSGYITSNTLTGKGEPSAYITRCYAGAKVTKAKKPFVPWAFEYIG